MSSNPVTLNVDDQNSQIGKTLVKALISFCKHYSITVRKYTSKQ